MNLFRGEVIDNVGQQSPFNKTKPRLPEPGAGTNSINLSQSVTQILASMGKDGYINPREGLAVISAYTDTWKETMTARFNNQEEKSWDLKVNYSFPGIRLRGMRIQSRDFAMKLQS